jgi:hypothetical protein
MDDFGKMDEVKESVPRDWHAMLNALKTLDPRSHKVLHILNSGILSNLFMGISPVEINGSRINCGGRSIDLASAPMTLKVFTAFAPMYAARLDRSDLVERIYGKQLRNVSPLRRSSLAHSVVKLVSRARTVANESFAGAGGYVLDWFPYDAQSKSWRLFRVAETWNAQKLSSERES